MAGYNGSNYLSLDVVWVDGDCVEIGAKIVADDWSGLGQATVSLTDLFEFASEVRAFAAGSSQSVSLKDRFQLSGGHIHLRFAERDSAGHMVCHVDLEFRAHRAQLQGGNAERFFVVVATATEPTCVDRFGRELISAIQAKTGRATLVLE